MTEVETSKNLSSSRKTFTDYLRLWFKWVLDPAGRFLNNLGLTPRFTFRFAVGTTF